MVLLAPRVAFTANKSRLPQPSILDGLQLVVNRDAQPRRDGRSVRHTGNIKRRTYGKYAGTEIELGGEEHPTMREEDLLAVMI
jgi:hypothetical protein